MINLSQEFEGMSIEVAVAKVTLPYSTAKRRVNQWNEACNNSKDVFPGSSKKTRAKSKLNDEHTTFMFEKMHEQPTLSCNDDTTILQRYEAKQKVSTSAYLLEAITAHGVITLSKRNVCAPTNKKRKADDDPAPKKGTIGSNFMQFTEQVLTNIEPRDLR
ncbi:hypothetical protein INT45_001737 [Circinella minor]|uniref:Uncharacterized protein n=1 Tax=Circinella minor TaxID=1195481 RepID=A0A8H7VHS7_9FUNG|nr:hypothetical protein INT45_001737 [Circinella minor]